MDTRFFLQRAWGFSPLGVECVFVKEEVVELVAGLLVEL